MLGVLHHRRAVDVDGFVPAERLVQKVVLGRAGQVLAAADHMGNAHQVVVHHVGEVVGGHPVAFDQDLVVQLGIVHLDVAVDHIVKGGDPLGRDLLPDHIGFARRQPGGDLPGGQVAAVAVIVGHLAGGLLFGVQGFHPLFGAETVVGFAGLDQLLGILFEKAHALALDIGPHRAADVGAFVPGQAGSPQRVVDDVGRAFHQAALVGILDAQDEGAAVVAGLQVGVQRGAQVAHMHVAGGRRRKAGADGIGHDGAP